MEKDLTKICTKCGLEKTITEFNKQPRGKFGVCSWCNSCRKQYDRQRYLSNKDQISIIRKKYYFDNKKDISIRHKKWHQKNKEYRKQYNKQYQNDNKDLCRHLKAKRRARKLKQTPDLSENELKIVKLYYKLSIAMGEGYHVDHIIPIAKGGSHHPSNLQIITVEDNLSKHDKLDYVYKFPRFIIKNLQLIKKGV